jgi:hypothetical protein
MTSATHSKNPAQTEMFGFKRRKCPGKAGRLVSRWHTFVDEVVALKAVWWYRPSSRGKGHVFKTMQSKQQQKYDGLTADNFMAVEGMKLHNSSRLVRNEELQSEHMLLCQTFWTCLAHAKLIPSNIVLITSLIWTSEKNGEGSGHRSCMWPNTSRRCRQIVDSVSGTEYGGSVSRQDSWRNVDCAVGGCGRHFVHII